MAVVVDIWVPVWSEFNVAGTYIIYIGHRLIPIFIYLICTYTLNFYPLFYTIVIIEIVHGLDTIATSRQDSVV